MMHLLVAIRKRVKGLNGEAGERILEKRDNVESSDQAEHQIMTKLLQKGGILECGTTLEDRIPFRGRTTR